MVFNLYYYTRCDKCLIRVYQTKFGPVHEFGKYRCGDFKKGFGSLYASTGLLLRTREWPTSPP